MTRKRSMLTQPRMSKEANDVRLMTTLREYTTALDKQNPCVFRSVQTVFSGRARAETIRSATLRFTMNRFDTECNFDDETRIKTLLKLPRIVVIKLAMVRDIPVEKS